MTLFEKINELGTTVLIVTHEKGLVDEFEKRVVVIDNGEVISDQTGGYYQIGDQSLTIGRKACATFSSTASCPWRPW